MALALLLVYACKKDDNTPVKSGPTGSTGTTGTNGVSGATGGTGSDTRAGLELLLDPSTVNYCILINDGNDTIILQDSRGDKMSMQGGVVYGTTPPNYMAWCNISTTRPLQWKQFGCLFELPYVTGVSSVPRNYIDSLITGTGTRVINGANLDMNVTDSTGLATDTWGQNTGSPFKIISITKISESTGCYRLRVTATFSNVSFTLYHCIVQYPHTQQGEFQLDFTVNTQ